MSVDRCIRHLGLDTEDFPLFECFKVFLESNENDTELTIPEVARIPMHIAPKRLEAVATGDEQVWKKWKITD